MKKGIITKKTLKEVFQSDETQKNTKKREGNREYSLNENQESGFSLEELHNLTSYAKKKAYCREHLKRLGTGSSRMVFELNDETVLKLAINKKGLAQNDVEWDMRNELSFTAKVFDIDEDVHRNHYAESVVNKEKLIIERIRNEFDDNLPCSEIFMNDIDPNRVIDHDLVDQFMSKDTYKSFPIKSVRVDMIIPTQKNLDNNKLAGLDVNQDTGAILFEENGKYYIIDGHHRIAKNILNNNTSIKAYVKECAKRLHESAEINKSQDMLRKKVGILKQGFDIICQDLQFTEIPKLHLINDLNYTSQNKSFAAYAPATKEVYCVIAGRNTADCMRSIAHELMHHKQNLEYRLYNGAGEDGTDIENEANAYAGKIMRKLGREIENIFEDKEKLTEGLKIITKNQLLTK